MAEYNDPRYRVRDSHDRMAGDDPYGSPQPSASQGDPLAELARLIGQGDPFSHTGRAAPSQPHAYQYDPAQDHDRFRAEPAFEVQPRYGDGYDRDDRCEDGDDGRDAAAYDDPYQDATLPEEQAYDGGDEPVYDPSSAQPYAALSAQDDWREPAAPQPPPAYDPFAAPVHQAPLPEDSRYDSRSYVDPRAAQPAADPRAFHTRTFATRGPDFEPADPVQAVPRDRPAPRGADPFAPRREAGAYDAVPPDDSAETPAPFPIAGGRTPPDDFYDDAAPRRRNPGFVTVMAVLALAVLGTAGAFAYRTVFGGPGVSSPPPVIRASTEPTKVVPPAAPANDASRLTFDRFGDRSQNEQVVSREEKPVDINSLIRNGDPRGGPPGAPAVWPQTQAPGAPALASAPAGVLPPNVIAEPRRVRTVPIRPDQPDGNGSRPQAMTPLPAPPPAGASPSAPRTAVASALPANAPLEVTPAIPSARQTPLPPSARPAATSGPLALIPDAAQPPAAARVAPPTRVAAAPVPISAPGGGFVVQVSSQRSEADAQSAYRSLQSRYSGVLGGQKSFVKRADLGERGTYYRAVVGPFGSRAEAVQLCASLKAAGGDCVVQTN